MPSFSLHCQLNYTAVTFFLRTCCQLPLFHALLPALRCFILTHSDLFYSSFFLFSSFIWWVFLALASHLPLGEFPCKENVPLRSRTQMLLPLMLLLLRAVAPAVRCCSFLTLPTAPSPDYLLPSLLLADDALFCCCRWSCCYCSLIMLLLVFLPGATVVCHCPFLLTKANLANCCCRWSHYCCCLMLSASYCCPLQRLADTACFCSLSLKSWTSLPRSPAHPSPQAT